MKKRLITLLVLAMATTVLLVALPAEACCFFKFRGISCGPDSNAQITIFSTGPSGGAVGGDYAYISNNRTTFSGFRVGTGSRTINIPSRILDSYSLSATGGATIIAHGPGCS